MPGVRSERWVKQRDGDAVLTQLHRTQSQAMECDISVIAGGHLRSS
jgi:hypothetical protein